MSSTRLPFRHTPWSLRIAILATVCGYLVFAARGLYVVASIRFEFVLLVLIAIAISLAVGLVRRSASARTFTVWVLWLIVFVIPIGVINPFAAIDWAPNFPSVEKLALIVYSGVAVSLMLLHFFIKHKRYFG